MTEIKPGVRFKIGETLFEVKGEEGAHSNVTTSVTVIDADGLQRNTHYLYLGDRTALERLGVKFVESAYEYGQAYKDADGDIFVRASENRWAGASGTYNDSYPTRPLVKIS